MIFDYVKTPATVETPGLTGKEVLAGMPAKGRYQQTTGLQARAGTPVATGGTPGSAGMTTTTAETVETAGSLHITNLNTTR